MYKSILLLSSNITGTSTVSSFGRRCCCRRRRRRRRRGLSSNSKNVTINQFARVFSKVRKTMFLIVSWKVVFRKKYCIHSCNSAEHISCNFPVIPLSYKKRKNLVSYNRYDFIRSSDQHRKLTSSVSLVHSKPSFLFCYWRFGSWDLPTEAATVPAATKSVTKFFLIPSFLMPFFLLPYW